MFTDLHTSVVTIGNSADSSYYDQQCLQGFYKCDCVTMLLMVFVGNISVLLVVALWFSAYSIMITFRC